MVEIQKGEKSWPSRLWSKFWIKIKKAWVDIVVPLRKHPWIWAVFSIVLFLLAIYVAHDIMGVGSISNQELQLVYKGYSDQRVGDSYLIYLPSVRDEIREKDSVFEVSPKEFEEHLRGNTLNMTVPSSIFCEPEGKMFEENKQIICDFTALKDVFKKFEAKIYRPVEEQEGEQGEIPITWTMVSYRTVSFCEYTAGYEPDCSELPNRTYSEDDWFYAQQKFNIQKSGRQTLNVIFGWKLSSYYGGDEVDEWRYATYPIVYYTQNIRVYSLDDIRQQERERNY